jgi:hypothetical protein
MSTATKLPILITMLFLLQAHAEKYDISADATDALTSNIAYTTFTIGVDPMTTNYGLRSIMLYSGDGMRLEPDAIWPDGTPVTSSARISTQEMVSAIELTLKYDLFTNARKYYSERSARTENSPPPPMNASDIRLPSTSNSSETKAPKVSLQFNTFDDYWYQYFNMDILWDYRAEKYAIEITRVLSGEGKELFENLINQMKIVQHAPPAGRREARRP